MSFVAGATEVHVSVIVLGELRAGFRRGTRQAENEAAIKSFFVKPGVHVVGLDEQTDVHYAAIESELREKGRPIPTNDVWIAALAAQHGFKVYTRDLRFKCVFQIEVV